MSGKAFKLLREYCKIFKRPYNVYKKSYNRLPHNLREIVRDKAKMALYNESIKEGMNEK